MASKTYSVRVPQSVEVGSDNLDAWLDEALDSGAASLVPDLGPGPKTLRLSADSEKVEQVTKAAGETEPSVSIRRVILSHIRVGKEPEKPPRPKPAVLPRNLRIEAQQIGPVIAALDHVQTFLLERATRCPEARQAAHLTEIERADLSRAAVEVVNRRAPAWLVENIDLVGAVSTIASVEGAVIRRAYDAAAKRRQQAGEAQQRQRPGAVPFPAAMPEGTEDVG